MFSILLEDIKTSKSSSLDTRSTFLKNEQGWIPGVLRLESSILVEVGVFSATLFWTQNCQISKRRSRDPKRRWGKAIST